MNSLSPQLLRRHVLFGADNPLGLRIGLTYAGVSQLGLQVAGMYELFKPQRNLKMHAYYMRQSLLLACLIPALMRLPELTGLGFGGMLWMILAIPLYYLNEAAIKREKWY
jgi:hypothetical protein